MRLVLMSFGDFLLICVSDIVCLCVCGCVCISVAVWSSTASPLWLLGLA